jgi:amidase
MYHSITLIFDNRGYDMNKKPASDSMPVELHSMTALLDMLAQRHIGSLELLELLIKRIERLNPALNAVIAMDLDAARTAARAADNAPPDQRGPLHGLPMTIKDAYEVRGMTASCGIPLLADHRPGRDAEAVALLRHAGAIPFGKTNTPVAAADHQSYNPLYGSTNNPWDVTRTPGGSSGGAAAAVAAGCTPLELGSDIGGSIRCPAHFCGIYGHKPSYGIVPMRGHIPPMPGTLSIAGLGVGGPLARSAADLELALDVLVKPGSLDNKAWSVRLPQSRHQRLQDFRVALWADQTGYRIDSRCLEALHAFAEDLRRAGVTVDATARPELDPADSDDLYIAMLFSILSVGMTEEDRRLTVEAGAAAAPGDRSYPARIARAMQFSHRDFLMLQERQQHLFRVWESFFTRYDLMLCPVMPTVAFPHDHSGTGPGHIAQYSRRHVADGQDCPYMEGLQWPGLVTVAHLPATALPTGRFIEGLPMGLQAVGPYLEDRTSLRFARLVEREIGGYVAPSLVLS